MKIITQDALLSARPILSRKLLFYIVSAAIVACPALHATVVPPKNKVVATIPVGTSPLGIVVSPKDTVVYVANVMSNTVSKIDAKLTL